MLAIQRSLMFTSFYSYIAVGFDARMYVRAARVGLACMLVCASSHHVRHSAATLGCVCRYGRLLGVLCVYGTLIGLAQGSLTDMALETDHGDYKWATVVQLGLMAPLYAWVALVAKRELSVKGPAERSAVAEQRQHSVDIHTRAPSLQERSTGPRSSRSSAQHYLLE